ARALGVAQNALELGLAYAMDRVQFQKPIFSFPRVHGKLALAAVEVMMARQLSHFAAREKDAGRRCDLEAGMAKLLAARIAWSNADNALQI
ncbi:acyl-CoA dehydrogenase family protein, partial [Klebsiella pneumoniae]|uniref:acyl-CoA dehydrogenase family protein n=1 Tax=Klebsiella pneumoniae TaxID=573 RepID=UPI003BED66F7